MDVRSIPDKVQKSAFITLGIGFLLAFLEYNYPNSDFKLFAKSVVGIGLVLLAASPITAIIVTRIDK